MESGKIIQQLRFFWVAMSIAGYSTRQADIDDAIEFVASFGRNGIEQFGRELDTFHEVAQSSGLAERVEVLLSKTFSRRPTEAERRAGIESLAVIGRAYFSMLVDSPGDLQSVGVLESPFAESLQKFSDASGGILPAVRGLRTIGPLRRSGETWVSIMLGFGVGVRQNSDWPFRTMQFSARLEKAAAICSQSEEWLQMRKVAGVREVDVNVEYWREGLTERTAALNWIGPSRIEVFLPRGIPAGDQSSDGVSVGDEEAKILMAQACDLILQSIRFKM